jgi:hypothetical protein
VPAPLFAVRLTRASLTTTFRLFAKRNVSRFCNYHSCIKPREAQNIEHSLSSFALQRFRVQGSLAFKVILSRDSPIDVNPATFSFLMAHFDPGGDEQTAHFTISSRTQRATGAPPGSISPETVFF